MSFIARFAVKHRWFVIVGWVLAVVAIQVASSSAGGASYKEDFKLPGTEIQKVSDLLDEAGFSQQNNAVGTMVLHRPTGAGTLEQEPTGFLDDAKAAVCDVEDALVATIITPWGSISCDATGESSATPRQDLLSRARTHRRPPTTR
jgi:RND superfamily putative drug exporter